MLFGPPDLPIGSPAFAKILAADEREFLLALWGPKIVDGPHGRCPVCLERRSEPNVCSWDECPSHKKKEAGGGPDAE